ncbi:MAG: N-acetylmuramoyl-L-alanine amidase [Burkholderiales bacterium]|nr:N-acetylmuramoyl-L-alanine amidase [Burkholderiales bacterium]
MSLPLRSLLAVLMVSLSACAPFQVQTILPVRVAASPNFDQRKPNYVILHHTTDNTSEKALHTLTSPERQVSAHYLISRDGSIFQLVEESARAWHAGQSWWGGQTDMNSASIGIELDNNGDEPYADAQINTLLALLTDLRRRYNIPAANFIGHADVAPLRKADPGILFPWQRLAAHGFGLWCDAPLPAAPKDFDLPLALTALGYDPNTLQASRRAFRLHYVRGNLESFEDTEKAMAYCLLQKKILLPQ